MDDWLVDREPSVERCDSLGLMCVVVSQFGPKELIISGALKGG